jgi:regulator of sirC expression with transglutaminase-like and TPR domain
MGDVAIENRFHTEMKQLTESQKRALMQLLGDDDPVVQSSLQEKFLSSGEEGISILEEASRSNDNLTRQNAATLLGRIRVAHAVRDFEKFCASAELNLDLEKACVLLARTRDASWDEAQCRRELDEIAAGARTRFLHVQQTPENLVASLNKYLFGELHFRGNTQNYYDPDNSYLNRVLERRLGNPILLSTVYLLTGKRLQLPLVGVGMPAHFIVRWKSRGADFFIDPFNAGAVMNARDCERLIRANGVMFRPEFLEPATPLQMLARMCVNLRQIYEDRSELAKAKQFARFIELMAKAQKTV